MPYSNANDVVISMASDVLPVVKHTPVIAGVCASDPGRDMGRFLRQLKDLGFAGVQNFPTVGLIDGNFRANLEETGMGYGTEVEMVRIAHEMGLVTTPYVFNPEEARMMVEAGADVIVAHSEYPRRKTQTFLPLGERFIDVYFSSGIDKFRYYWRTNR
jgi:predicted TIM-barrel enzyme